MILILKFSAARIRAVLSLLVIATGLVVGVVRLALPLAADYRPQLERELSRVLGMPVRIQRLEARLRGLSPELRLGGVQLQDPATRATLLRLDEVRLRLGLLASIRHRMPVLESAALVGARLLLRRGPEGRWRLLGSVTDAGSPGDAALSPAPFLSEGRLRLLDCEIQWESGDAQLPPLHLRDVDAMLVNAGSAHRLDLRARLGGNSGGTLEAHADFSGDPADFDTWRGGLYVRGQALRLAPLAATLLPERSPVAAQADLELWSEWRNGLPTSATGTLVLDAPRWGGDGAHPPFLDRLGGRLRWQRESDGWRLDLPDLVLVRNGQSRPPTQAALRVHHSADGTARVRLGAGRLWLQDLAAFAAVLEAVPGGRKTLAALAPRGELRGLDLALRIPPPGQASTWRAAGGIFGLELAPWQGVPGVRGLDLAFRADQEHGLVHLASDDLVLIFDGLFRRPLQGRGLAGELAWQLPVEGGLVLSSDELRLDTPHLHTRSRLRLRLPADGGEPFIDMQSDFHDGDGTGTGLYLPAGIMPPPLVQWLDRAIVAGRVTSGTFLLRGPAGGFPYRDRSGRFEVLFGVEQAILDYHPGWPRLEEAMAEVLFDDESLAIDVQEARLLESRVQATHMHIPDLGHAAQIPIRGLVDGPFADGFRILRETPLAATRARYIRGMQAVGDSEVRLDLTIPLKKGEAVCVDGEVRWNGAGLELRDLGLKLERIRGRLGFSERGLSGRDIQARLLDGPVRLDVSPLADGAGEADRTRIDLDLQIDPRRLAAVWPSGLWEPLEGSAPARLRLDVRPAGPGESELPLSYTLSSRLRGLAVDLPPPLGKTADEERRLSLAGTWPPDPGLRLDGVYGDLRGGLRLAPDTGDRLRVAAGALSFREHGKPDLERGGLRLSGHLERLDLDAWSRWLDAHPIDLSPGDLEDRRPLFEGARLRIDELALPALTLRDLTLVLTRTPDAWALALDGDRLQGEARIPDDPSGAGISLLLKRLDLDPAGLVSIAGPSVAADRPQPRGLPPVRVRVDELSLDGRPVGRLALDAVPMEGGMRLETLTLAGPLLELSGTGEWTAGGGRQSSHLALEAHSPDLGKALRTMGITSALDEADLNGSIDLSWPASPLDVSLADLSGDLDFHLGAGRVLEVEPGVGRIFGLLNLAALNRRLTLDFSDLFGKGYAFDHIDGGFTLADGSAQARDLVLRGPAADLEVSGSAGLVTRDYDQMATVTPKVSTTLPLAGGLAGGPAVAAALLVLEKVMGDEVNKLLRFQYRITGPWDEPRIERITAPLDSVLTEPLGPRNRDEGQGREREPPANPFLDN